MLGAFSDWVAVLAYCFLLFSGAYWVLQPTLRPLVVLGVLVCLAFATAKGKRNSLICLASLSVGALWSLFALANNRALQLHPKLDGIEVHARVWLQEPPREYADGFRALVRHQDPSLPPLIALSALPKQINAPPIIGECWELRLRLRVLQSLANPHAFDFALWQQRRGVGAAARVIAHPRNARCQVQQRSWLHALRGTLLARLRSATQDDAASAVIGALMLGDRSRLAPATREVFVATGTSHLMAISGLHVGMVAACAFWLGRRLRWPRMRLADDRAALTGLLAALMYALVSGFAVPAQRAVLLLALAAVCHFLRVEISPLRLLGLCAVVIFVFSPLQIISSTFVMSFAAVVLLCLQRRWQHAQGRGRQRGAWRELIAMQLLLSFALSPLTAAFFSRISLVAPLANLLLIPAFTLLIVPLILLAALALLICPPLALPLLWCAHHLVTLSLKLLGYLGGFDSALLEAASFSTWAVFGASAIGGLLVISKGVRTRGVLAAGLLAIWLRSPPAPAVGCLQLDVLDVGHGAAVILRGSRANYLYDTGPRYWSGGNAATSIVLPFLRAVGVKRIDRLLISHGDSDHAGGLRQLHSALRIQSGLRPGSFSQDYDWPICQAGQRWHHRGVDFHVLWPPETLDLATLSSNNHSCVIEITIAEVRLLLTGDIEQYAERELAGLGLRKQTVLLVPHHGSRSSSTAAFVATSAPRFALVSAARNGRWQLPHPSVEARYREIGAQLLVTATHGAITVRACRDGRIAVQAARHGTISH